MSDQSTSRPSHHAAMGQCFLVVLKIWSAERLNFGEPQLYTQEGRSSNQSPGCGQLRACQSKEHNGLFGDLQYAQNDQQDRQISADLIAMAAVQTAVISHLCLRVCYASAARDI